MNRIMSTVAAAALVAVGVSACGAGEPDEPTTVTTTVTPTKSASEQESETSGSPSESESSAESASPSESSTATSAAPSGSSSASEPGTAAPEGTSPSSTTKDEGDDSGAATAIRTVWVDDSWTIEEPGTDVCEMGGLTPSYYSQQDDVFTCGPTAAGALACKDSGGTVTCITNALGRHAIRFESPSAGGQDVGPREESIPLYVELEGGATCETISHDHDQHWGGKLSWYRCNDGSELLTDEQIGETFDTSAKAWTAQRSVDKAEPETVRVETAAYAGT